jgi:mRNA interferase RelE/StbE
MDYKVLYTKKALKNLEKLPFEISRKITKKIRFFVASGNPLKSAKKLKNTERSSWRFRIGDYRAIFGTDETTGNIVILIILKIAHRKKIYKDKI